MTATYESIATNTLGSSSATVNFTSISGSYTDLVLIINCTTASGGDDLYIRVNSDTGSNYSLTQMSGDGSSTSSSRRSNFNQFQADNSYPSTTQGFNQIVNFMNYSNTTTYKTFLSRTNRASQSTGATVGLWRSTSAITSINLVMANSLSFATGSTFTLYGIKAE